LATRSSENLPSVRISLKEVPYPAQTHEVDRGKTFPAFRCPRLRIVQTLRQSPSFASTAPAFDPRDSFDHPWRVNGAARVSLRRDPNGVCRIRENLALSPASWSRLGQTNRGKIPPQRSKICRLTAFAKPRVPNVFARFGRGGAGKIIRKRWRASTVAPLFVSFGAKTRSLAAGWRQRTNTDSRLFIERQHLQL
jgi:hypothetical protein